MLLQRGAQIYRHRFKFLLVAFDELLAKRPDPILKSRLHEFISPRNALYLPHKTSGNLICLRPHARLRAIYVAIVGRDYAHKSPRHVD
jgi:hypothetical protein